MDPMEATVARFVLFQPTGLLSGLTEGLLSRSAHNGLDQRADHLGDLLAGIILIEEFGDAAGNLHSLGGP